jgi:hypothetical protein
MLSLFCSGGFGVHGWFGKCQLWSLVTFTYYPADIDGYDNFGFQSFYYVPIAYFNHGVQLTL